MQINIYMVGKKKLIGTYNVRNIYDGTFYHRNMPTLSAKRCREILNTVSPGYKIESELFILVDADTGYTGTQIIYRRGTVLNF